MSSSLEELVPDEPRWTDDAVWRGSFTAARAKLGWALADFIDAVGDALPDWLFGILLQETAAGIRRGWLYPPGIESGAEYAEYLDEIERLNSPEHP